MKRSRGLRKRMGGSHHLDEIRFGFPAGSSRGPCLYLILVKFLRGKQEIRGSIPGCGAF